MRSTASYEADDYGLNPEAEIFCYIVIIKPFCEADFTQKDAWDIKTESRETLDEHSVYWARWLLCLRDGPTPYARAFWL